jgi:hypothetical protein
MERATEPTVSEYLYQSRLDAQSFRLLTIHPKTCHDALIHCSLETFDLRNQPAFVALSYTWGNAEDVNGEKDAPVDTLQEQRSISIQLDSGSMAVTPNLLDALLQLRGHKFEALLWVDAICVYSHRTTMKYLGTLRFPPQFFEGFHSSELGILS